MIHTRYITGGLIAGLALAAAGCSATGQSQRRAIANLMRDVELRRQHTPPAERSASKASHLLPSIVGRRDSKSTGLDPSIG